jgi:hypothetical protein
MIVLDVSAIVMTLAPAVLEAVLPVVVDVPEHV